MSPDKDFFAELKTNIESELRIAGEMGKFVDLSEHARVEEKRMYVNMINSLRNRMRMLNDSVPALLEGVSPVKELPSDSAGEEKSKKVKEKQIEQVYAPDKSELVAVRGRDKQAFLKELNIGEGLLKKLRKRKLVGDEFKSEYKNPSSYGKISNKFFLNNSENAIKKGKFKSLGLDIRRSNMNILTVTYISMMYFSILASFFVGILLFVFFMFFSVGIEWPVITFFEGSYLQRVLQTFWIMIAVPAFVWASFYLFPGAEKRSLAKKIDQELPFVVIHMGSVSGSGIEPIKIFKIIGLSKEYKFVGKEIRKILNQTNVYGYDLTNALRNVALSTPSSKLAELLNGISITINSGGDIQTFLEKRSESLLLEYRLEREKFTKTAETFMDIYISIVIAAPMILLMLLIMIAVSGISVGLGVMQMTIAIIGIVAIINILFLTFLHMKQPGY